MNINDIKVGDYIQHTYTSLTKGVVISIDKKCRTVNVRTFGTNKVNTYLTINLIHIEPEDLI